MNNNTTINSLLEYGAEKGIVTELYNGCYAAFNFGKGRKYRMYLHRKGWWGTPIKLYGSGINITLAYNGVKYGIGQKQFFGNMPDAVYCAELTANLLKNSDSYWASKYTAISIENIKTGEQVYKTAI